MSLGMYLRIFDNRMLAGQKSIVGVKGSIQQIEAEEFSEKIRVEQVCGCDGVFRVLAADRLKTRDRTGVIHDIETIESFAHLRVAVQRIRVHSSGYSSL